MAIKTAAWTSCASLVESIDPVDCGAETISECPHCNIDIRGDYEVPNVFVVGDKYDVRMVTSGIDAITMILKKTPDLILLDYEMPLLDGKQTMEKIKNLEEAKDIPIVFVTAVNDKEHIRSVLELKPAGYLLKPVDKDRLLETVEAIIGE